MESKIQSKIKAKFERAGWLVVKLIKTNTNGIPDLMCLKSGKTIFVEVKQQGKVPTPLQLYRHEELRAKGFEVLVLTDADSVIL